MLCFSPTPQNIWTWNETAVRNMRLKVFDETIYIIHMIKMYVSMKVVCLTKISSIFVFIQTILRYRGTKSNEIFYILSQVNFFFDSVTNINRLKNVPKKFVLGIPCAYSQHICSLESIVLYNAKKSYCIEIRASTTRPLERWNRTPLSDGKGNTTPDKCRKMFWMRINNFNLLYFDAYG